MRGVKLIMGRIDLLALLARIDDYVLIKKSNEFPVYIEGSDVDLIVYDKENVIKKICSYHDAVINDAGEVKISDTNEHCHIDMFFGGKLEIRIDLIDNLDFFENIEAKSSFIVKIFKDRKMESLNGGYIYVPSEEDDLTLRYFEYLEYFNRYHNKIKHLDYICSIDDQALKQKFIENTHQFIQFKRKLWLPAISQDQPRSINAALKNIKKNFSFIIFCVVHRLKSWGA
jgi:hypothetical protein